MNAHFYKRIEIAFWDLAIQALSENNQVRSIVRTTYRIASHKDLKRVTGVLAATAMAGLLSGFLLCVASLYLGK
jgi:hypothetical protein